MSYKSLDYIVRNVMVQLDETNNMKKYQTYLQFAIRGMRELNLTSSQYPKTVFLDMLPNKAVNLPSDYIKYTKIGICVNGHILTLGLDDSLCLNDNFSECGDPLPVAMDNLANANNNGLGLNGFFGFGFGFPFLDGFSNNQFTGGLFGIGGGFNSRGYYKINSEANQIQFTSEVPSKQIVLEYISNGINLDGTANVPQQAVECLIAWVHWKRLEYKRNGSPSEAREAERKYNIEFRKVRHFNLMFSVSEYMESQAIGIYQSVKR